MTAFDSDIHVPLIVTGPGVPAGRTIEEIVENIDLHATLEAVKSCRGAQGCGAAERPIRSVTQR